MQWLRARAAGLDDTECDPSWPYNTIKGYPAIKSDKKTRRATHVILELSGRGPRPPGMEACHNCGVSMCLTPRHLRWDTPKANQADRLLHGTDSRGERYYATHLTEVDVLAIRASQDIDRVTADRYGVARSTITNIRARRTWKHIE